MIPVKDIIPPKRAPKVSRWVVIITLVITIVGWWLDVPRVHQVPLILVNVVYLWIFADNVEDRLGHARFLCFYAVCALAGTVAQALLYPTSLLPVVGMSAGTAGVVGAYFVLYPRSRVLVLVPLPLALIEVPAVFYVSLYPVLAIPFGPPALAQVLFGAITGVMLGWVLARPITWSS